MNKLLLVILLIVVFVLILWIIYIGSFRNVTFFKLKYRMLSLFSSPEKMDKLNSESIKNAKIAKKEVSIIIHGAASNYYSDIYGATLYLKEKGLNVVSFDYDYKASPDISVEKLNIYINDILKQTETEKVNIVGFCLGGNLAEYYARKFDGYKKINKLITILSPLKPVPESGFFYQFDKLLIFDPKPWNDTLLYPTEHDFTSSTLHIYGKRDFIVPTKYQIPDKGNSFGIDIGHSPLLNVDRQILDEILNFVNANNK